MKAIYHKKYGSTKNLFINEISKPTLKSNEVLIKMLYTSINSADLDFVHGHPLVRFTGLLKPGYPILGSDCIGVIEEIESSSSKLNVGDIVCADLSNPLNYGTFAQYVNVPISSIQKVPSKINLKHAACLPTAAMVALQNINLKVKPKLGDKVLVNGAGGGIGNILVQLLKSIGADITAVDKKEKHEMLKTIGATRTIDYREIDYSKESIEYDYVYDLLCTKKISKCAKVVKKNGYLIVLGGSTSNILKVLLFSQLFKLITRRNIQLGKWDTNNQNDLSRLGELCINETIIPVIDKVINFEEIIEGLKELEDGNVQGKIVVSFE